MVAGSGTLTSGTDSITYSPTTVLSRLLELTDGSPLLTNLRHDTWSQRIP